MLYSSIKTQIVPITDDKGKLLGYGYRVYHGSRPVKWDFDTNFPTPTEASAKAHDVALEYQLTCF